MSVFNGKYAVELKPGLEKECPCCGNVGYLMDIPIDEFPQYYTHEHNEEEKEMKKYTLKQYEEFCRDALVCPPFEVDDQDELDEWFEENKITIRTDNHEIELEYDADVINEIEFSLKEMHEALYGDGTPTTGNTQGSQYRPAEFKDVVRWYITTEYERVLGRNYNLYAQNAVDKLSQMHHFSRIYQEILGMTCQDEKYGCDFTRFNPASLKDATKDGIKKIVLDWVGTHIETSYDPRTDKTFIIDYTFKAAGDFIGWFWGEPNDEDIKYYVAMYKHDIFDN
jgi:hypothetical protein